MRIIQFYFLLTVVILFTQCNQETLSPKQSGVSFYSLNSTSMFKHLYRQGITNNSFNGAIYDSGMVSTLFYYDTEKRNLEFAPNTNHDSNSIFCTTPIGNDQFIALAYNYKKFEVINGVSFPLSYIEILDNSYKPVKVKSFRSDNYDFYGIWSMKNGDYLLCYSTTSFISGYLMTCVDKELNVKWTKKLHNVDRFDLGANSLCISNNYIYVVENMYLSNNGHYNLYQYDINGDFLKVVTSKVGVNNPQIAESDVGCVVFGNYILGSAPIKISIDSYGSSCELLARKEIDCSAFSLVDIFSYQFPSAILKIDDNYFFTVNVRYLNFNGLTGLGEEHLVKINPQLEIEWAKLLDKSRVTDYYSYLASDGKYIVNMGISNWAGNRGFSIILTDMEGNAVH